VYKGLDIGTGKITKKEMRGVPHHLLDVTSPRNVYTVAQYIRDAEKILQYIVKKGKVPIIAGGTGFYIDALLGTVSIPEVPPNNVLRNKLEKWSVEKLYKKLQKLDPKRAQNIERHHKRRLIRAIEIATALGNVPLFEAGLRTKCSKSSFEQYDVLKIGIKTDDTILKKKIKKRLLVRLRIGMIAEVKKLHRKGLSWKRMDALGLEYRHLSRFLKRGSKVSKDEMIEQLNTAIWQYAKRQKNWFRRDKKIRWFTPSNVEGFTLKEKRKIDKAVTDFLKSRD